MSSAIYPQSCNLNYSDSSIDVLLLKQVIGKLNYAVRILSPSQVCKLVEPKMWNWCWTTARWFFSARKWNFWELITACLLNPASTVNITPTKFILFLCNLCNEALNFRILIEGCSSVCRNVFFSNCITIYLVSTLCLALAKVPKIIYRRYHFTCKKVFFSTNHSSKSFWFKLEKTIQFRKTRQNLPSAKH